MSGKLKSETVTRIAPGKARRSAQLLPFPGMKKPRGRPRKDDTHRPATESFDVIANAIKGLGASDAVWSRAAERQRMDMQGERLAPTTVGVVGFITDHLYREARQELGYGFHGAQFIADALDCIEKSVKRAFKEGVGTGYLKRRQVGRRWQTTLPKMIAYCIDVQRELEGV